MDSPLVISSLVFLLLLSGGVGLYYLLVHRRVRKQLDGRLERLGGTAQVLAESRQSLLLRWGARFDRTERAEAIEQQLIRAELDLKPSEYVALTVLLGIAVFFIGAMFIRLHLWLNLTLAVAAARSLPNLSLRLRRDRYIRSLNEQLVDVAMTMSNSLRAGLSLQQAIHTVAREIPPPAGHEFELLAQRLHLGASFESAAKNLMDRLPSQELKVLMTAILVQRRVGGNLAKALSETSHTIAERQKLNDEIRTMTAEARYSSLIIPFLPIAMLLLMRSTMPEFVEPLFNHPIGWIILGIFGGMQLLAFIVIRRLSDIRV